MKDDSLKSDLDKEVLVFYTTAGCHLCDLARAVYQQTLSPEWFTVRERDIAESDELIAQYGSRIPVLKRSRDGSELAWPFDARALMGFLPE